MESHIGMFVEEQTPLYNHLVFGEFQMQHSQIAGKPLEPLLPLQIGN